MVLDLFILGCLKEKPLDMDFLIETAKFIRLDKWTNYKKDLLLDRINILEDLNFIKIYKNEEKNKEKHHNYIATENGIFYFKKEIKKYLDGEEVNMGMLILFLTFSEHFSTHEIRNLLEAKLLKLNDKMDELQKIVPQKFSECMNTLGYLSLKTSLDFRKKEILLYEDLLEHVKSDENWKINLNL